MHPPLGRPHPDCQPEIQALVSCHEENPWGKFLGACNEPKSNMDWCFKMEKEKKRKANADKARAARERYEKAVQERDSDIVKSQ